MKGTRTLTASFVGTIIVPILVQQYQAITGIELTADQQVQITAWVMGGSMFLFRLISTGPVGAGAELVGKLLARKPAKEHEEIAQLVVARLREAEKSATELIQENRTS